MLWYILIVAAVAFLIYSNSIPNEFVWDDVEIVKENQLIRSLDNLPRIFTTHWWDLGHPTEKAGNYRPLAVTSLLLNYKVTGLSAEGFRVVNIGLHTLNSLLVLFLAMALGIRRIFALMAALLFAVHPVHTEAVVWIVGRAELLACTFFLASLVLNISTRRVWLILVSLALYFCALLSKESAIALPALIFAFRYLFVKEGERGGIRASFVATIPYIAVTLIYLAIRVNILGSIEDADISFFVSTEPYYIFLTMTKVALYYVQLLFYPVLLRAHYDLVDFPVPASIGEPAVMAAIFIHIIIFAAAAFFYRKDKRITFSIVWFYASLAIYMHIIPFQWLMAERFLYIPSVGFSLLAGLVVMKLSGRIKEGAVKKFILGSLVIIFIAGLSVKTITRNLVWKNEITFFSEIIRHEPGLAAAHANLGYAYFQKNRIDEAINSYQRAVDLYPGYTDARRTLNYLRSMKRRPMPKE